MPDSTVKALIVSADGFEDSELQMPMSCLQDEGIAVEVASIRRGTIRGKHGCEIDVDKAIEDVRPEEYDVLIVPGGKAPASLRRQRAVIDLVRAFMAADKPVAAICHGPQILVSADVLRGRRATGYHAVAAELRQAGALYADSEVVVDGNLITARQPADLPAFMRETMRQLHRPAGAAAAGRQRP